MNFTYQENINNNHNGVSILYYDTESENGYLQLKKQKIFKITKVNKINSMSNLKCDIAECNKIFNSKIRLEKHISSHFYVKIFKCKYENCLKGYKSRENLILHVKNKHLNIKPYKCSICFNSFSHRNGKIYHERKFHKKTNI